VKEIKWKQWGPAAFEEARRLDKPVLLAISAVWCHWCHVMDHTSYSDLGVVDFVNENFIPVRVDNDLRPDINDRYNMGGWPSAAFLTPDGYILQGCTYLPPDQFLNLAAQTKKIYESHRNELDDIVRPVEKPPAKGEPGLSEDPEKFYRQIVDKTLASLNGLFDPLYGGFGWQPKFPYPDFLRFLLVHHAITRAENSLRIVAKTLHEMGKGGLYDHAEDGFFRYSITPDWAVPHYEKMLSDNAELLSLYCDAYRITGDEELRAKARGVVKYMMEKLYDPARGGFRGSQDADEQYYARGLDDRKKRGAPAIDQRKFADWNGLAASAFFKASAVLGDNALRDAALNTLKYLKENLIDETLNVRHEAAEKTVGYLPDHVNAAAAFLAAHEYTGDTRHLGDSVMLAQTLMTRFWDKEAGGLLDTIPDPQAIGYLKHPLKSVKDNSRAAELFVKLHLATDDDAYGFIALHALQALYNANKEFNMETPSYACAALILAQPHLALKIAGRLDDEPSRKFLAAAHGIYEPRVTIRFIDMARERTQREKLGLAENAAPAAFLCDAKSCRARITAPDDLKPALAKALSSFKPAPPTKPKHAPDM
jgi:hypothetical protein